ncbi:hypothetical protein RP20_CCG020343 [Aedes albopictus]|nr:uncharacterized protein LOC109423297 [Aedes albopictus]KXJ71522.1 hypothetical protein RP20_CCG020343 [Aedes albopictus]
MVLEHHKLEIGDLPNEIQLQILDYLNYRSRCTASEVCRLWNALAFTGRFMDRVCLRLDITEDNLKLVCTVLSDSIRNYRHITINFNNQSVTMMDYFSQVVGENDALESLTLWGMDRIEPVQLLMLLNSCAHLERLCLLDEQTEQLNVTNVQGISADDSVEYPAWLTALSSDSPVRLQRLRKLRLMIPGRVSLPSKPIVRKFPNVTQLHLTSHRPSNVALFNDYRNKLEKISILTPSSLFVIAFSTISFPKLNHLYLGRLELHDQLVVAKWINFFQNPAHTGTLEQLMFHPKFMMRTPIFATICSNCSALRELELSLDYMDGDALKDVTNLQHLQKLSLQGTAYFRETPHWPYQIRTLKTVRISGSRFPINLLVFIADIAPSLTNLTMEDVENPKELFETLPELVATIRSFQLNYSEGFERPPSSHPSGLLRSMHNLESYHLQRVIIKHGIQGWLQDAPQLRMVTLTDCSTLTDTHLVILTTNCPKLEWLKLKRCPAVTMHGLEEFRARNPSCKIDVDGN